MTGGNTLVMARQSRLPVTPPILLTRPAAQSQRFAAALEAQSGPLRMIISPLMAPVFLSPPLPARSFDALILTSETAVEAARRISAAGETLPKRAFCVGDQTALAARKAGFSAISAQGDANDLKELIAQACPIGALLHLRGTEVATDFAEVLTNRGTETFSAVAYSQKSQPLSDEARNALFSAGPVIIPLFSPRSARLLVQAMPVDATAELWIGAISPAVAAAATALSPFRVLVAKRPDGVAMQEVVKALIDAATSA